VGGGGTVGRLMPRPSLLTYEIVAVPPGAELPGSLNPECFGCGPENEHSLRIKPWLEGDRVVADLSLVPWLAGGPGVAHGGALATFFDELMGYVAVAHRAPAVTARFEIDFVKPVLIGARIRGEAWLASREGRRLLIEGVGRDEGEVCVEARSLYLTVGLEHFAEALAGMSEEQLARLGRFRADEFYP
jgi:acyl-coenzyme A thioesterase PaaI-like protein